SMAQRANSQYEPTSRRSVPSRTLTSRGQLATLPAWIVDSVPRLRLLSPDPAHPVVIPLKIDSAECIEAHLAEIISDRIYGSRALPLVDFCMAISKRKTTRAVMIRGWDIAPSARGTAHNEKTIIDRIWVFIDCHPHHRRLAKVRLF